MKNMTSVTRFASPLGGVVATAERGALTGLYFVDQRYFPADTSDWREDAAAVPFAGLRRQLAEYFTGRRRVFDLRELPLDPGGGRATVFQRAVWDVIFAIPLGATTTYSALALACGRPAAARASGAATGRNPISLIIPCHRVVGSDGTLTGYAGGLDRKRTLLAFENSTAIATGAPPSIESFAATLYAQGEAAIAKMQRPVATMPLPL
ncbi:MAG: methylated-DNA--[protein]-cysteine S-methyltransferase [Casimicrobiaceae bacterium]